MDEQQLSRFDSQRLIDNREMRIFLSSTFSDMDAERTALIKTFDTLKIEVNQRNVTLSVVDLRWGVTEEEARSGKVLSVCFEEIEHSHPFFIGLLGSRYGTSPSLSELEKNPELEERYPWIRKDIEDGMSITEMEIQYGILRNSHDVDAAFFIKATPGTVPDDNVQLTRLKEKIKSQNRFSHDEYHSIDDLCYKLEQAIRNILDKHFPVSEFNALDSERTTQKAYINSRHGFYQRQQADFDRLDTFLTSDETHLVITGPSGMGKSALIANWLKEQENKQPPCHIIYHFVGNSFSGSDYHEVLQHICNEIYNLYGLERREYMNEKLEDEAQRILLEAGQTGKLLLVVIDGINQIIDRDYSKLLNWLPQAPKTTKYLFSTLDDDETMATFKRRGYPLYQISALDQNQRKQFILEYLGNVGKHLTPEQLNRILEDPENENMLVLRTLLDELICFGSYDRLDERIDYYLSASSIEDFFDRMLQRMEDDYKEVPRILSLIALSENGMTEDELQAIIKLRPVDIHLFYCTFYNHTVTRGGLITFAHKYVTDAIWGRYSLNNPEKAKPYRQQIIDNFSNNTTIAKRRRISELAFQYYNTDNTEELYKIIMSFEAFVLFNKTDQGSETMARYWRRLLAISPEKYQLRAYLDLPFNSISFNDLPYIQMGEFVLTYFGDTKTCLMYYQTYILMGVDSGNDNSENMDIAYNNIGMVYDSQGDYLKALEYHFKVLAISERTLGREGLIAASYNNIGRTYTNQGNYPKALEYYFKALTICERIYDADHPKIAVTNFNIGFVYYSLEDYQHALEYYFKGLTRIERALGTEHLKTATSYNNIGAVYDSLEDYPKALEYYFKALNIRKRILGSNHPTIATLYNNIGSVYNSQGDYQHSLEYNFRGLTIIERFLGAEHPETAGSYNNIGLVYYNQGDYTKAFEYYFKALNIRERILGSEHPDTASSYNNIGYVYYNQGDYQHSLEYYLKALTIDLRVFDTNSLRIARDYNNIGLSYHYQMNYSQAFENYQKALDIFERLLGIDHPNTKVVKRNIEAVKEAMAQNSQRNYDNTDNGYYYIDL